MYTETVYRKYHRPGDPVYRSRLRKAQFEVEKDAGVVEEKEVQTLGFMQYMMECRRTT